MREAIAELTPSLRRYAHALMGALPCPAPGAAPLRSASQDADDLLHDSLMVALYSLQGDAPAPADLQANLRLGLYRRITLLARRRLAQSSSLRRRSPGSSAATSKNVSRQPAPLFPRHLAPPSPRLVEAPLAAVDLPSREVLALVVIERLSYADAGLVLGMSVEQLLPRLALARARLAGAIAGRPERHLHLASNS